METTKVTFGEVANKVREHCIFLHDGNESKAQELCKRVEASTQGAYHYEAFYLALANNVYIIEKKREARASVQEEARAEVEAILAELGLKEAIAK